MTALQTDQGAVTSQVEIVSLAAPSPIAPAAANDKKMLKKLCIIDLVKLMVLICRLAQVVADKTGKLRCRNAFVPDRRKAVEFAPLDEAQYGFFRE